MIDNVISVPPSLVEKFSSLWFAEMNYKKLAYFKNQIKFIDIVSNTDKENRSCAALLDIYNPSNN